VDFPAQPLPRANLTFDVVDDLVGAHARGRPTGAPQVRYAATDICPLIELMMEANNGRAGPLLQTGRLDSVTQMDLRTALASITDRSKRSAMTPAGEVCCFTFTERIKFQNRESWLGSHTETNRQHGLRVTKMKYMAAWQICVGAF
jgi:hypothetical protein